MAIFAVAGVFSAEVTKAPGNETLIRSPHCGVLFDDIEGTDKTAKGLSGLNFLLANDTIAATAYSRACYGNAPGGSQCHQYAKPNIPWKQQTNVSCPFSDGICEDNLTFEMDTGFINSHDDLGVNTKTSDRIEYRKKTTCSILVKKGYVYFKNITDVTGELQQLVLYSYTNANFGDDGTYPYNLNDVVGSNGYALT